MHATEFAIFTARVIATVVCWVAIPTAFVGAVVGWNAMALAGCLATVAAGTVVTLTNER